VNKVTLKKGQKVNDKTVEILENYLISAKKLTNEVERLLEKYEKSQQCLTEAERKIEELEIWKEKSKRIIEILPHPESNFA
jgi:DNA repair ATPase RecN